MNRVDLDQLAELEEERRFLLRSLADLEREHDVGDIDDADYVTLRDGYTVRAAAVLREIDGGRASLAPKPPRRWGRTLAVTAAVVAGSVAIGFVLAAAWGERQSGQEITGFTPGDDARLLLANAREAMTTGDFALANSLFAEVVEMERAQGRDNAEAIAYFGWTLALLTVGEPNADQVAQRLDAAQLALDQAIGLEPRVRGSPLLHGDRRVRVPRRPSGGTAVRGDLRVEQSAERGRRPHRWLRRRDSRRSYRRGLMPGPR